MAVPPAPPPLEQLGPRPFSFYPAIGNITHNEWLYERATWSEVQVRNTKTAQQIWVPRRLIGDISRVDEPVMIVGLTKEMEYRSGALWPVVRRVIEMPLAVNDSPRPMMTSAADPGPAPVVGIRVSDGAESRIGRMVVVGVAVAIIACVLVVTLANPRRNVVYTPIMQSDLTLTNRDDYYAVVRDLGQPQADRWLSDKGERQFRVLEYPKLGYSVILMGTDRNDAHYIGAMDKDWKPVHYVQLPGSGNSYSILRQLRRF